MKSSTGVTVRYADVAGRAPFTIRIRTVVALNKMAPTIRFDPKFKPVILSGEKDITIRYDFDKFLMPKADVRLLFEDHEIKARIINYRQCLLRNSFLIIESLNGSYPSDSIKDIYDSLNVYYGNQIRLDTKVLIIRFEVIK